MRVLLSTIGSRGDVQPLVALAVELTARGQEVRLCLPPDFRDWVEGLGLPVTPIGPELRPTGKTNPMATPLTPEQRLKLIEGTVAAQFETITQAAAGCDLIVGATALQVAAPSVAERMGIPYVFAAYCPTVLPARHHPPPVLAALGDTPPPESDDYTELWVRDAQRWNATWKPLINARRTALGLSEIADVRSHILTDRPWLAADATLGPWPGHDGGAPFQPGAWILPDTRPLDAELQRFLEAGAPPIYFGFGSIKAPDGTSRAMIESARVLGRRAIVSRGWAELSLVDDQPDCLSIGEVNQQALFARVAAVVHHGGAGTTTAAARAGAPQVVIPQHYDQHYWAGRVGRLGIGTAHPLGALTTDSLTRALELTVRREVADQARSVARSVRSDGAQIAAESVIAGVTVSGTSRSPSR